MVLGFRAESLAFGVMAHVKPDVFFSFFFWGGGGCKSERVLLRCVLLIACLHSLSYELSVSSKGLGASHCLG